MSVDDEKMALPVRTECANCGRKVQPSNSLCSRCRSAGTLGSAKQIAGEYSGNLTVRQLY